MRKTYLPVGQGDFLPLARDEVLIDSVFSSVVVLVDQLAHFVDDPQMAAAEY